MDLNAFAKLKKACKEMTEKRIRAEGLQEDALERIKDLGFASIKEAEKELAKLQKEQTEQEQEIAGLIEEIQDEFPDL